MCENLWLCFQFISIVVRIFHVNFYFMKIFLVTPDDMWTPYKRLHKVIETYLIGRAPEGSISSLELVLQKHRTDFINVLKNSVK